MNAKYQMHLRLREITNPSNPTLYPPILIKVNILNMSAQRFSDHLKTEVIKSYIDVCIMNDCYVCDNSNQFITCLDCLHYVDGPFTTISIYL